LIIMSESLPLSVITGEVWHRLLPPSRTVAGVERLRPQIMDLAELESLEQWSDRSLLDLLREKQHVRDLSIEPLTEFCMMRSFHRGRLRLLPELWDGLVDLCRQEFAR